MSLFADIITFMAIIANLYGAGYCIYIMYKMHKEK